MQAIHTALVYRTLYGPGKAGRHGTTMVTEANVNVSVNSDIQGLIRACNGYYSKDANVPMMRIAALPFFDMCLFLRVDPLQMFSSSQIDVWDPATRKILKLSLYEARKRWAD